MLKVYKNAHAHYTHVSNVTLYYDARINGGQVEVQKDGKFAPRPDLVLVKTGSSVYTWPKDVPLDQNGFRREVVG